jgi:hypothetical protein
MPSRLLTPVIRVSSSRQTLEGIIGSSSLWILKNLHLNMVSVLDRTRVVTYPTPGVKRELTSGRWLFWGYKENIPWHQEVGTSDVQEIFPQYREDV